jgi:hypothetical protein
MKNTVLIDFDSEREKKVIIGKPSVIEQPQDEASAKAMIIDDISCVCEALCELIHIADQNNYGNKEDLTRVSISLLNGGEPTTNNLFDFDLDQCDECDDCKKSHQVKSLDDEMKLSVILNNLDKYSYLEICEMFEAKLPFDINKMK